jgi:PAS domain S-box-containing protein/putative nucleotidyltransferase with HDIG domain
MLRGIKKFFSPIKFPEDKEKNRTSQVLHTFWINIWLLVGLNFTGILFVFIRKLGASILMVIFILILIIVRYFHRRGKIRLASFLLVFGLWATYMTVIVLTGTIRTSVITLPIAIVAMIVPLLGLRVGLLSAIVTLLVTLGITLLEIMGNPLPTYFPAAPLNNWFHLITAFAILIIPLGQVWKDISTALAHAQKSEEKHRLLFEEANDAIFIMKGDRIIDCNTKATEMFGHKREQIIGKGPQDFSPDIQPNGLTSEEMAHKNLGATLRTGKSQYFEWRHIHKNRSEFDVEVSLNVLELNNEKLVQAIVRDITERKQAEQKLAEAYDTTLEGWAKALELRDKETEDHSRRVVKITLTLARAMGIEGEQLAHIRRGAILHDIGKMGIPDEILRKRGKLTISERKVIEQHPVYSYELLSRIPYLEKALDIPYCHHEHWDGSGYPRGLKGEEIPLAARIFSVVDVWDAIRSDRPYSKAWSREKAVQYIKEESGKYFDPEIVDIFLNLVEQDKI